MTQILYEIAVSHNNFIHVEALHATQHVRTQNKWNETMHNPNHNELIILIFV